MQAGGRTDPMGCRIFRSKRAAVFETGSGNRSVRNAQYAYGRAAGSRKNHDLRADGYNPAATYKKEQLEVSKYTVSAVCWQTPGHCCRNGRFAVRIIRSAWQGLPAVDEVSGRERFHWHIMVCFFWMNSQNFPNQRWKCCVSRWRNIRFI